MTQPVDIEALRALMERATAGPWAYRPQEHDDWGFIRTTRATEDGWHPVVAIARDVSDHEDHDAHRAAKTDPAEGNAALIVAAVNALPSLLTELEALRAERGRMENSLKVAEDAMREMFRYYDGGEMRGSYDGKPERNGLRKAWYEVRSTLATLKEPSQ